MHPALIAELLAPFLCHSEPARRAGEESAVLSAGQLARISTYIDLLLHWNARINLTAIRGEEEIVSRHFGESLFAAQHLLPKLYLLDTASPARPLMRPTASLRVADLGSGAGFPGIPIKLWAPDPHMTLIESSQKKSTFLREVVRSLTLTGIDIQTARAESLTQAYDVVTLRAVERFASILPIAARLTAPNGRLALLIGLSQLPQVQSALPSLNWNPPLPVPGSDLRVLLIGIK